MCRRERNGLLESLFCLVLLIEGDLRSSKVIEDVRVTRSKFRRLAEVYARAFDVILAHQLDALVDFGLEFGSHARWSANQDARRYFRFRSHIKVDGLYGANSDNTDVLDCLLIASAPDLDFVFALQYIREGYRSPFAGCGRDIETGKIRKEPDNRWIVDGTPVFVAHADDDGDRLEAGANCRASSLAGWRSLAKGCAGGQREG